MCIANICKIKKVLKNNKADVDYCGLEDSVDIRFLDDVILGDYVLVHAGFAIKKIDRKEALKMIKLAKEVGL